MTDGPALLRSVLANPGDDAPRLIYADWLDESAAANVCPQCGGHPEKVSAGSCGGQGLEDLDGKCFTCNSTGVVSNGNRERAEFIRVQCELARLGDPQDCVTRDGGYATGCTCHVCALRRRERDLLNDHWRDWIAPLTSGDCHVTNLHGPSSVPFPVWVTFRRGWVSAVTLPLGVFLGGRCERCGGSGVDPESECKVCGNHPDDTGTIEHGRGCYTQDSDGGGYSRGDDCDTCGGRGTRPGVAKRLFETCPLEAVTLSDREPYETGDHWFWSTLEHDDLRGGRAGLPDAIRDHMGRGYHGPYPTASAALAALSAACVNYGRQLAGLAPLDVREPNLTSGAGHGT